MSERWDRRADDITDALCGREQEAEARRLAKEYLSMKYAFPGATEAAKYQNAVRAGRDLARAVLQATQEDGAA